MALDAADQARLDVEAEEAREAEGNADAKAGRVLLVEEPSTPAKKVRREDEGLSIDMEAASPGADGMAVRGGEKAAPAEKDVVSSVAHISASIGGGASTALAAAREHAIKMAKAGTCGAVPQCMCGAVPQCMCGAVPQCTCGAVPQCMCGAVPQCMCGAVPQCMCGAVPQCTCAPL